MTFKSLETVALTRDFPEHGLQAGDLGAIVQVLGQDGFEVEFVTANGRTQALVTLGAADIRHLEANDLVAVRRLNKSA